MPERTKRVIGLVGDACAGKSSVAKMFAKLGATVYDADAAVHKIYAQPDVIEEVRTMFGDVLTGGKIDRVKLAAIVFSDLGKMKALTEKIVFPRTAREMEAQKAAWLQTDSPVLLLDAPTLFEAGRADDCDRILYLGAPRERRIEWAKGRNWPEQELDRRDARLNAFFGTNARKRERADAVVENDGSLADLEKKIVEVWNRWVGGLARS